MSKYTVLVVDDDKDVVRNLRENLAEISTNYSIKTSNDGKEALEIITNERLDLVILDVQIPGINGLQLLSELHNKGIWLPVIIITDSNINENDSKLKDFGIVDFIKKPFLFEKVVLTIDEIMKNKEKKDLIKNLSLPSILQLIEMEKRTGVLTIKIGKENGRIFFKSGKVMDVEVKGLSTSDALEEFIHSLYEDREISIEYINHRKDKKIDMSLMQIVMEASRIKDEKRKNQEADEPLKESKKTAKNENLQIITDLLNSLREVENFIIVNEDGDVLSASPAEYNEDVLNSSIYLNIIGDKLGADLNLGIASSLICHLKSKKRLIRKFADFIVIMELTKMTKYSVFKEKFHELLDKITLKLEGRRL